MAVAGRTPAIANTVFHWFLGARARARAQRHQSIAKSDRLQ